MLTVVIQVNGREIYRASAVNQKEKRRGRTVYKLDGGNEVLHRRDDGPVKLAQKILADTDEGRGLGQAQDNVRKALEAYANTLLERTRGNR